MFVFYITPIKYFYCVKKLSQLRKSWMSLSDIDDGFGDDVGYGDTDYRDDDDIIDDLDVIDDLDGIDDNDVGDDSDSIRHSRPMLVQGLNEAKQSSFADQPHKDILSVYVSDRSKVGGKQRGPGGVLKHISKAPKNHQTYFYIVAKFLSIYADYDNFVNFTDLEHMEHELWDNDRTKIRFEEMNPTLLILGHAILRNSYYARTDKLIKRELKLAYTIYNNIIIKHNEENQRNKLSITVNQQKAAVYRYFSFWKKYYEVKKIQIA